MGALQDKFITYMTLRGFSPRTHESYMHAMGSTWCRRIG